MIHQTRQSKGVFKKCAVLFTDEVSGVTEGEEHNHSKCETLHRNTAVSNV